MKNGVEVHIPEYQRPNHRSEHEEVDVNKKLDDEDSEADEEDAKENVGEGSDKDQEDVDREDDQEKKKTPSPEPIESPEDIVDKHSSMLHSDTFTFAIL